MLGANQMGVTNGEKMNLQVGGPTNTIVFTENQTGVTLIMDLTLYQLGHASTTKLKSFHFLKSLSPHCAILVLTKVHCDGCI